MGKPKLATKDNETKPSGIEAPRQRPQEGNDAQRRRCRVLKIKGFHPEP
jgi:hypothetical protein